MSFDYWSKRRMQYFLEKIKDKLDLKINTSDIVDNLTTQDATKALSAKQGYVLDQGKVDKVSGKGLSTEDYTTAEKTKLAGIASGAEVNVQSDWNQTTDTADDYIKNKPTLGTASAKDVPTSGNASTTQVVMGDDTRLTDARNAADVYSWAKASTKPTYTAGEVGAIATTAKGSANGVAELDSTGKVPSAQLPSYVDDVVEGYYYNGKFYEESTHETEIPGESGKIYVDLPNDTTYRWSGTAFTQIKGDLALGETSTTAYRGDRGKTAYDHSQTTSGNPHNVTKSDVGLGNVGNFKAVSTEASQGLTDTEKSNARTNIGAGTSSFSGSYNDLSDKPTIPTVNDGTLTIQRNGVNVQTFSANQSTDVTADIAVPTAEEKTTTTGKFTTETGGKLESCIVAFNPVQSGSGDPSPSNVRPITGHNSVEVWEHGKNYLPLPNPETLNGVTLTYNDDGSVTLKGTATSTTYFDFFPNGNFNTTKMTGYVFSMFPSDFSPSNNSIACRISDSSRSALQDVSNGAAIVDNGSNRYIAIRIANGYNTNGIILKPMLVRPTETDTTYEPYQGQDVIVNLGGTYYGGTLDVVSGVLTAYFKGIDLGDYNYTKETGRTINTYKVLLSDAKSASSGWIDTGICETYKASTGAMEDASFSVFQNKNVYIADDRYSDATSFKTAVTGYKLVYELETPIVIQLTPQQINTLIGENNIDTPLDGQSLTSAVYRELFAWDDVTDVVESKAQHYEQNQYLGINLFDILEQGTIKSVDGTPTDGTNRCRTNDYVDVIEGTRILINKPTTVKLALYRYDASKNFIDWFNDFWAQNTEAVNYEYVIPSGTKYIKMVVAYASEVDCVPSDFAGYTLLNVKSNAQLDITKQICKQFYGTCDSAADTVAKVVTVSSDQNFVLTTGCTIYVKFTNTNSASNITLDVNGSGAKSITYAGDTVVTGSSGIYTGTANYTCQYIYDGTYWKWMGYSTEKDTTYSSMSLAEMQAGTATSNRVIRADRLAQVTEERIDAKLIEKLYKSDSFTSSTSASTTVTATNSAISISSTTPIDVYSDVFGLNVEAMSVSGSGTSATISITFPKTESVQTINYRVYVKTI